MAKLSVPTDLADLKPIVEAMIFASEEPLGPRTLIRLLFDDPTAKKTNGTKQKKAQDASLFEGMEVVETVDAGEEETREQDVEEVAGQPQSEEEGEVTGEATESSDAEEAQAEEAEESEPAAQGEDASVEEEEAEDVAEVADTADEDLDEDDTLEEEEPAKIGQKELRLIIEELNEEYELNARPFRIVEIAGGFQFATTREYGEFVGLLSKERSRRRLSQAALETLAIVAYRQPVTKPEVEAIRGVNCDQVLLSLLERNLLAITGRADTVGKPLLYGSTDEFLRVFGLNSLSDLPKLRELEELMEEEAHSPTKPEVIPAEIANELLELAYEAQGGKKADDDEAAEGEDVIDGPAVQGENSEAEADSEQEAEAVEEGADADQQPDDAEENGAGEEKSVDEEQGEEDVSAEAPLNPLVSSIEIEAHLEQQEAEDDSGDEGSAGQMADEDVTDQTDEEAGASASDADLVADQARA